MESKIDEYAQLKRDTALNLAKLLSLEAKTILDALDKCSQKKEAALSSQTLEAVSLILDQYCRFYGRQC